MNVRVVALYFRQTQIAMRVGEHGPSCNNGPEWFLSRDIDLVKLYGSNVPEGITTIKVFPSFLALRHYAYVLGISLRTIVVISDQIRSLMEAKDLGFVTIGVSPAQHESFLDVAHHGPLNFDTFTRLINQADPLCAEEKG